MDSVSSPVRRSIRLARERQSEQRSPIKFMTSAEAIRVSDSDSSSDENDRKRARYAENIDTDDDIDGDNVESEGDMDDDDLTDDEEDELIIPAGKKQGGSILFRNMRTRSTCKVFRSAITQFTTEQRLAVASMGLESMLQLEITRIPSKIARFVVNSFDHSKIKLVTEAGSISVSEDDVRKIMGLPLGGRIFRTKDRLIMTDLVRRWQMSFNDKCPSSKVKCSDIAKEMIKLGDGGELFKLHFLVLFYSAIVMSIGNQYCNQRILNCIDTIDDIRSLNWCENVIFSAVTSKKDWLDSKRKGVYTGPILFLMTLYITRFEDMKCKFNILCPAIRGLKNNRLLNRQKAEIKRGGFGKGLRIVKYDGSPKISKSAMNGGGNDAEASTSRQHYTDTEAIMKLLKDAAEKLANAKKLYDSAPDETKNDREVAEAVEDLQSKMSQFMMNSNQEKSYVSPMDFEGPSFSMGPELDDVFEKFSDFPTDTVEPVNDMPGAISSDPKGKNKVSGPLLGSPSVEKWTLTKPQTPVFASVHASPYVEKRTDPTVNTAVLALETPRVFTDSGKSVHRTRDYQNSSYSADGQGKYVMKTPDATLYYGNTSIVPYSADSSSRHLPSSHNVVRSSFVTASRVQSDNPSCAVFSPILPLQQRDDDFRLQDLPIVRINNETDSSVLDPLPVNVYRGGRHRKPAEAMKSPFVERITNIKEKLTQSEINVCDYVFECEGDNDEIMFKWGHLVSVKSELATLSPEFEPSSNIIDIWTCILNKKEELRQATEFLRFFCTFDTTMLVCRKYHSIERKHQLFASALDRCLGRFPDVNLSKISMLFFPVYHDKHFILVCCDFKRVSIEILVDHLVTNRVDIIYSAPVQNLLLNLGAYLREKNHFHANVFPRINPVVLILPWATQKKNNSNVIFLIRHMETYAGGGLNNWKCGLKKEGYAQTAQIKLLRQRYLNEIVRFEENTVRIVVMRECAEYRRWKLEDQKKMVLKLTS